MALFGYLFDSNFKDMRDRDKVRGESAEEVSSDPFEDARTVRRLRADMARVMILNRALIRLLIQNDVITLEDLTLAIRQRVCNKFDGLRLKPRQRQCQESTIEKKPDLHFVSKYREEVHQPNCDNFNFSCLIRPRETYIGR